MSVPSNITSATAIIIPSIPYVNVQTDIHDAGVTYTVWYKYTANGTEGVVGEMFRGAGAYTPSCEIYIDDDTTLLGTITANRMSQIPLLTGRIYFFKVIPNGGNPNPATLTVDLVKQSRLGAVAGNIFIRAASIDGFFQAAGYTGLGAGVINHTNGIIKDFDPVFQVGESGDYMPVTGEFIFADEFNTPFDKIRIYNPTLPLTLKATVVYDWHSAFPIIRTWREGTKFLIVDKGQAPTSPVEYFTIDRNGVKSATIPVTAGSYGCGAAAMNPDGTFVYMSGIGGSVGAAIKKWDVVGGVFAADFAAGVANKIIRDLLVMKNGEVIALYHESAIDDIFVRVYSAAGVILQTYTAPAVAYTSPSPRLGYANNDSISFWLFLHQSDGFSRYFELNLADVSVLTNITAPSSDYFLADQGVTPAFRLVTSDTCPFVLFVTVTPTGPSGIYKIILDRRNDNDGTSNVAIPAPTFKTALLP